jgi:hypothetical protein
MDSGFDASHRPGMTKQADKARQNDPPGKSKNLSSPSDKNISLNPSGKSSLQVRPSHPNEGRVAIVTKRAVGCGGR